MHLLNERNEIRISPIALGFIEFKETEHFKFVTSVNKVSKFLFCFLNVRLSKNFFYFRRTVSMLYLNSLYSFESDKK